MIDFKSSALILGDLQNDFLHRDGAYGCAGQSSRAIAALTDRLASLVHAARERGIFPGRFSLSRARASALPPPTNLPPSSVVYVPVFGSKPPILLKRTAWIEAGLVRGRMARD
jgi:hypothetical protein